MHIDKLQPGRELDNMMAVSVFEWQEHDWANHHALGGTVYCTRCGETRGISRTGADYEYYPYCDNRLRNPPSYSTDLSFGWRVVDQMIVNGYYFELHHFLCSDFKPGFALSIRWYCKFGTSEAYAHTPELAICRAALKAVMEQ